LISTMPGELPERSVASSDRLSEPVRKRWGGDDGTDRFTGAESAFACGGGYRRRAPILFRFGFIL